MEELIKVKEAGEISGIERKNLSNYAFSKELKAIKNSSGRWCFRKSEFEKWNTLRLNRTLRLTLKDYEEAFEFAIKMAYSGLSKHGIRGERSEVQLADDVILGILVEIALKKFLKDNFNMEIKLDLEVHTGKITPQDIVGVFEKSKLREPKLNVGVKGSKAKSCFLVLSENEYERDDRKSDIYIFGRVFLPSDHLFRILRDHSFFKKAKDILDKWKEEYPDDKKRKTIGELTHVDVWICGYVPHNRLEKVKSIPGQDFEDGHRYVKNVKDLKNSDDDWKEFIKML